MTKSSHAPHLHVGIITQWYRPENVPIPSDIGEHLINQGHSVTVITGYPNYPTGTVYPGYRQRWRSRELVKDIHLVRVPLYPSHDSNPIRRALNYLSFAASTSFHVRELKSCDVIYVYSSPITATTAALVCKLLWKTPVVAHVQDLWPESLTQSGMVTAGRQNLVNKILHRICNSIYNRCSALITIAPRMTKMLTDRGVATDRITLVYNWSPVKTHPPQEDPPTTPAEEYGRSNRTVIYAGNLGVAQDLTAVVDALQCCGPELNLSARLIGDGVLADSLKERAVHIPQLTVEDPVDVSEMAELYKSSDFSLVTLRDVPLFEGTIPSKFQASLAHGLPVITSIRGDVAAIINAYGCGIVADPSVEGSLEDALREAASMDDEDLALMQDGCRRATRDLFDKTLCLDKLTRLLVASATTPTRNGH